jgi:hypothetical protein
MMRDKAYQEYQSDWSAVLERAKELVGAGERNLARVLALLNPPADESPNTSLLRFYGHRIAGRRISGIHDDAYERILFERILLRELSRAIAADTVNVIELGSGYSRNLFGIWLNGGPLAANYIGLEYTRAGRECGCYLAGLEPAIRYGSSEFDYYKPSLPPFDRNAKTFVFTCYSIEQITRLDGETFDALLDIPGLYKVVHIEPVGWQKGPRMLPFPTEPMLWVSTRISAYRLRYNTNLIQRLEALSRAGKITLHEPHKINYLAHRPNLPGSVLTWSPCRSRG